MTDAATIWATAYSRGVKPEPLLTVSEWADRFRMLTSKGGAEPGRWRTSRTPYLRGVMDALSPTCPAERIVFMAGAQLGKTECGNNFVGYCIHNSPAPILAVWPTVETAKRASKQRIDSMIEACPELAALVPPARSRDSGNTVLMKDFPGGTLVMTGANSAVGLRSMPVRFLFLDEVDGYPLDADDEGDPISLAVARTKTFTGRRKIFMCSTPTIAGVSRIEAAYLRSDQRRFHVPCPHCGTRQVLIWGQVQYDPADPDAAAYLCPHCGALIDHVHKPAMLAAGEWIATAPGDGRTIGFHLSGLYSPWVSWGDLAHEWIEAQGDTERLKAFVNTALAETWAEKGEQIPWKNLAARREPYRIGTVPAGACMLTAGVDVQKDRLECEVVGLGLDMVSWSVDYIVIPHAPDRPEAWEELTCILYRDWPHASGGSLRIARLAVDTGYATNDVYRWAAQHPGLVMPVKGVSGIQSVLGQPREVEFTANGHKMRRGAKFWPVGIDLLKGELQAWLRLEPPGEDEADPRGYCHFPAYPDEWFRQITAEKLVTRRQRNGRITREWELTRDRNEALDCRVYGMAAAHAAGIYRMTAAEWAHAAAMIAPHSSPITPPPSRRPMAPIKSRFVSGTASL